MRIARRRRHAGPSRVLVQSKRNEEGGWPRGRSDIGGRRRREAAEHRAADRTAVEVTCVPIVGGGRAAVPVRAAGHADDVAELVAHRSVGGSAGREGKQRRLDDEQQRGEPRRPLSSPSRPMLHVARSHRVAQILPRCRIARKPSFRHLLSQRQIPYSSCRWCDHPTWAIVKREFGTGSSQYRSCPRNCERRVLDDMPLAPTPMHSEFEVVPIGLFSRHRASEGV